MPAETARQFEALERQAALLMGVFTRAGHEAVAPAIIQPAGVFLDCIGEALRARTYVFSDPNGAELCLRPDLTVPTCRLHLERDPSGVMPARYCYNGAAFRYQPKDADQTHPREFRQAGIEAFGSPDPIAAEADTLALMVEAVTAAGLDRHPLQLRFGDLKIVRTLIDAVAMPKRWRQRLKAQFWRPQAFRAELKLLTADPGIRSRALPKVLVEALEAALPTEIEDIIQAHLERDGKDQFGTRSLAEIANNARTIVADARATPLDPAIAALIDSYLAVEGPADGIVERIRTLVGKAGLDERLGIAATLDEFDRRLEVLKARGLDTNSAIFSGEFGRSLEYYSGFVFEIGAPGLPKSSPLVGGGRYDGLMEMAGSPSHVPAVGAAIHTERLLASIEGRS